MYRRQLPCLKRLHNYKLRVEVKNKGQIMKKVFIILSLLLIATGSQAAAADLTVVVEIKSVPTGADVLIGENKNYIGQTPIIAKLSIGETYITFRKKGYYDTLMLFDSITTKFTKTIEVVLDKRINLKTKSSKRLSTDGKTYDIDIITIPDKTKVYIGENKVYAGLTPLKVELPTGKNPILLIHNGYYDFNAVIKIEGEMNEPLIFKMKSKLDDSKRQSSNNKVYGLYIVTIPDKAKVYVGGKAYSGLTPLKIELPIGDHSLYIRHSGYYDFKTVIRVDKEMEMDESKLSIKMEQIRKDKK